MLQRYAERKEKEKQVEKPKAPNKYQEAIEKAIKDGEDMDRVRKETNKYLLERFDNSFTCN